MQNRHINKIRDWPTLNSAKVRQFLGLANYYRRFVKGFSRVVQPLSDHVRKHELKWKKEQEIAFEAIQTALTMAPVLHHPNPEATYVVSTDASKYAFGHSLAQNNHPFAFLSHCLSDQEMRWDTGDQELLAFLIALREWRVYLGGKKFILKTDHEPIRYLQTKARLTSRQARWLDELQSFSYEVHHVPGVRNVVPDALTRRPDYTPELKCMNLKAPYFKQRIIDGYKSDGWSQELLSMIRDDREISNKKILLCVKNFPFQDGLIYWKGTNENRVFSAL